MNKQQQQHGQYHNNIMYENTQDENNQDIEEVYDDPYQQEYEDEYAHQNEGQDYYEEEQEQDEDQHLPHQVSSQNAFQPPNAFIYQQLQQQQVTPPLNNQGAFSLKPQTEQIKNLSYNLSKIRMSEQDKSVKNEPLSSQSRESKSSRQQREVKADSFNQERKDGDSDMKESSEMRGDSFNQQKRNDQKINSLVQNEQKNQRSDSFKQSIPRNDSFNHQKENSNNSFNQGGQVNQRSDSFKQNEQDNPRTNSSNQENGRKQEYNQDENEKKNNYYEDDGEIKMTETIDLGLLDQSYKEFLQRIATDQNFVDASYEQKISILIGFLEDQQMEFRLGSLIFLFELIYNFRDSLTEAAIAQILSSIYLKIPVYYETKDFYMVYTALEIIALIGPHSISFQNIKLLASILIDEALPLLQDKAFLALMNFDYPGLYALLDIANKDFNDIPIYILNKLAQTEEIQLSVIIPSLQNDITMGDMKKRVQSLSALNRMYSIIWKARRNHFHLRSKYFIDSIIKMKDTLPLLVNQLNEGTLDRQLIVSTIRACGYIGEQTLLKILKKTVNTKIKMAISTVLSWRVMKEEKNQLGIRIIPYNMSDHYGITPGRMCDYYGNQTPLAFVDEDYDIKQDYIEINSRDFMAALQRLLSVKFEQFSENSLNLKHNYRAFIQEFTLIKLIDSSISTQPEAPEISHAIIKALCTLLTDENSQVRETAVSSLGLIGLPEAKSAIDSLYQSMKDTDSQVRAMAAWCLGRLGDVNPPKVAKRLIHMLKDNYWKVRTAACVSIGSLGSSIGDLAFPVLTKILQDGTISKLTVCETLVRLSGQGEQILIDLLRNVPQSNLKLKTAIIQAFELADVQKPTIDFVIEEIFKNGNNKSSEVRKACLQALEILRNRAQDSNLTYLQSKNVLPLFYYFLQDSSQEIRSLALKSILNFGPQAELMFIEGLTKDRNPIIRQECAKGLGALGVQNFRALLFGLRDINEGVRKATAASVKDHFIAEEIIEEFSDKPNQLPALLCNIKDIFALPFSIDEDCKVLLESILESFGETISHNKSISRGVGGAKINTNPPQNHYVEQSSITTKPQQYQSFQQQINQFQQKNNEKKELNEQKYTSLQNIQHHTQGTTSNKPQNSKLISSSRQNSEQNRSNEMNSQGELANQYNNVQQTLVPAQKIHKDIPNMRGGMPAYTFFQPSQSQNQFQAKEQNNYQAMPIRDQHKNKIESYS